MCSSDLFPVAENPLPAHMAVNAKRVGTRRPASQIRAPGPPDVAWSYHMCDHVLAQARANGHEVLRLACGRHKLDHRRIDLFLGTPGLGDIYYGRRDGKEAHLVLDLRECTFLDPYGITVACALCHGIAARVGRIWICLPADRGVKMYCGVSGLIEGLGRRVMLVGDGSPGLGPSTDSDVLVPLQEISAEAELYPVLTLARERLGLLLQRIRWPRAVADRAVKSIMEVAANVLDHSGERGYLTLQAYGLASAKSFLVIAISDAGVGIRQTLATRNSQFRSSRIEIGRAHV